VPAPFGAITLDRLRPSDLEALLLEKRAAGYSDSTIRLIYTVCRGVLEVAVRDGIIRRNIATLVKRPGVKHQDARYLTPMKWPSCWQLPKVIGCMPLSSSCSAPAFVAVRRSGCIGPTSTSRAGIIRVRSQLTRVNRQLIFAEELKSEASQGYVSLPAPVVEVLRHHKCRYGG
jgi:integrase